MKLGKPLNAAVISNFLQTINNKAHVQTRVVTATLAATTVKFSKNLQCNNIEHYSSCFKEAILCKVILKKAI